MTKNNNLYGPYKSIQDALTATVNKNGAFGTQIKQRYKGLTVGIINNDNIDEYWFKNGVSDNDLIKKNVEDITELKLDGNKIEKTTFLFSSDLENSESSLMSKINNQISINIQNDTNLQNRVSEAVENSIQNSDTITNAINSGIEGNSTITKFNNLLEGENIKLDALPTALRELPNNFENGVIKDSVLPTGLQKFTSNLSNDGKLTTLDVLPTGVITETNLDSKLPNTLVHQETLTTSLASKADASELTNLQEIAITTSNFNSKIPTGLQKFTSKLSNDGELDITKLKLDGQEINKNTLALSKDIPTAQTLLEDENLVSSINDKITNQMQGKEFEGIVNDAISKSGNLQQIVQSGINNSTIIQSLQGKFDSDGKLVNTVLPTGLQELSKNLSSTGKINSLDILPTTELTNSILTTENISSKLPNTVAHITDLIGLAKTSELFDNGKLKDTYIPTTLATNEALNTLQDKVNAKADASELTNLSNSVVLNTDDTYKSLKNIKDNLTALSSVKDKIIDENNNIKFATYENVKSGLLNDTEFNQGVASNITEDISQITPDIIANNIITNKSLELIGVITNNSDFMNTLAKNDDLSNKIVNNQNFGCDELLNKVEQTLQTYGENKLNTTLTQRTSEISTYGENDLDSAVSSRKGIINTYGDSELQTAKQGKLNYITQIEITPSEVAEKINTIAVANAIDLNSKINEYVETNGISKKEEVENQIKNAKTELNNSLASKADSSDLTTLNTTVSGLQGNVSTLQTTVANKADSSVVTSLQKSVGTLNSRTLSNKVGFINIENNNIGQSNLDLIYNSITDARISADEVTMKLNPMETGYYYYIVNGTDEIISINNTLKTNLDENEAYNFVYIDGKYEEVTEYYYTLTISDIFKNLNFIYNDTDETTYSQIHSNENMFDVLLNKLQELGLNDYYKYLSELTENIKIISNGSNIQCVSDTKFYDLSLKWEEISQVLQKYNKKEYYLNINDENGNLNANFIQIMDKFYPPKTYSDINNSNFINFIINFINIELTNRNSRFYAYLNNKLKINSNSILSNKTLITLNKEQLIECQDITIIKYLYEFINDATISNIEENFSNYFNENNVENFQFILELNHQHGIDVLKYIEGLYEILINMYKSYSKIGCIITTTIFDDVILNMKLSRVLLQNLLTVKRIWEDYSESVSTKNYKNISNGSVSQYIVSNNEILELPYKFKLNSDGELVNWLNSYLSKCDGYITSQDEQDENELIYFGSENDINVLLNSYTYHIISAAFNTNTTNNTYELEYLTFDEVKKYVNKLSEQEKAKKIFLCLKEDNGYQYIFTQYVLSGDVLMTFQEDYVVQYATPFIAQLANTGSISVGGKQINFAKSDDVSKLTINSETNMEVVAQLVNGLVEDLTLIAQKITLTDNEKANLKVIDLTGTTGKLTYDITTGTYKSVKIEGNTPINPRPVTML